VKVIPALLALYPLVRRDWRMLGHFALGVAAGVVVLPVLVLGPDRTWGATETFVNQTILPGLTQKPGALSRELTDMTGTDNQSVRAIVHAAVNWGTTPPPAEASAGTKLAHAVVAAVLIVCTFVGARRVADPRYRTLFLLSGLVIVCVAVTPVNHLHYMVLALPAVVGLVYWDAERRGALRWGPAMVAVVTLHVLSGVYPRIPQLPGYQAARDLGVAMMGTLVVWAAVLWLPGGTRVGAKPAAGRASGFGLPGVALHK
jgi:hypothetical protein